MDAIARESGDEKEQFAARRSALLGRLLGE